MKPDNFIPATPIYSKEDMCSTCTHYITEHDLGPCSRTIGHIIPPDEPKDMVETIVHQSVKCNCKGFEMTP